MAAIKYMPKYESFNARYLTIDQLVSTFIPTKNFYELAKNNHTLLMGPRGCGKTTLLKMLTPLALDKYNNLVGSKKRLTIPFVAIYIPADRQWETQIDRFKKQFGQVPRYVEIVLNEIVLLNITVAICETFQQLISLLPATEDLLSDEVQLSKRLKKIFDIKESISFDLFNVRQILKLRIKEINNLSKRVYNGIVDEKDIKYPEYFFNDFFDLATLSCDAFEEIFSKYEKFKDFSFKWALCFDELEIAPEFLQKNLINNSLRSRDQKILLKLTTLPLVVLDANEDQLSGIRRPSSKNDYDIIRMWLHNKPSEDEWTEFSQTLFASILLNRCKISKYTSEIFGQYNIDKAMIFSEPGKFAQKRGVRINEKESMTWKIFKSVATFDKGFEKFLISKKIDPKNPIAIEKPQESSVLRKIKPIIFLRYYFRKENKSRSRNKNIFYFGEDSIYKLSDGNPRVLINLINDLIPLILFSKESDIAVSINDQSNVICKFSNEWLLSLCNHPDVNMLIRSSEGNPLESFLNTIGDFFRNEILGNDFKVNPRGAFVVDEKVGSDEINLLKFALDYGVIQYLKPSKDVNTDPFRNEEFRLSYTLYPSYDLPLREYESINLSTILDRGSKRSMSSKVDNQPKLFNEDL